jgi:Rod binding domain-containing protein
MTPIPPVMENSKTFTKFESREQNVPADSKLEGVVPDENISQAAKDFETAFIAQMLKFSGLTEALTTGGGEDMAAFTDFYIQSFAEDIVESGGFGLADKFYDKLALKAGAEQHENSINTNI